MFNDTDCSEGEEKVDITVKLLFWIFDLCSFPNPSSYLPGISSPYFEKWIYTVLKFFIQNPEGEIAVSYYKRNSLGHVSGICVTSGNILYLP